MSKDLRKMKRQSVALQRKILKKVQEDVYVILDTHRDESDWLTKDEIARKVMHTDTPSQRELYEVYQAISRIRAEFDKGIIDDLVVCRDLHYGFAADKETVDWYGLKNVTNGLRKVKRAQLRHEPALRSIGYTGEVPNLIEEAAKDFGFTKLEYRGAFDES